MNNKREKSDQLFDGLIRRAIVQRGFRPVNDEEVEAMLDGMQGEEISQDKLQRMLGKVNGEIPLVWEIEEDVISEWDSDSKEASELAAMYCAEGEELTPELKEILKELEKKAARPPEEDENSDADE